MIVLEDDEVDLVRRSFRQVARMSDVTANVFYDRLFAIAPQLRPMFPADMDEQGVKLMSMLGSIVAQLHDLDLLHPMVADLGRRHANYGAQPEHYEHVGDALLWALSRGLGKDFTPAVEAAWRNAFASLAETMIAAGTPPRDRAA